MNGEIRLGEIKLGLYCLIRHGGKGTGTVYINCTWKRFKLGGNEFVD